MSLSDAKLHTALLPSSTVALRQPLQHGRGIGVTQVLPFAFQGRAIL